MARKRQIDPDFCTDEDMAQVSKEARLFYILSWTQAEDTGVLEYKPITLKTKIFPYEEVDVVLFVEELIAKGKYIPYKNEDDRVYLFIKNFHKHQVVQHYSIPKLPLPPEPFRRSIPKKALEDMDKTTLSHTTTILLPYQYNRIELNRIELNRIDNIKPPSAAETVLKKVYNKGEGLNIYALINRIHKERNWPADFIIPDEILIGVCERYLRLKEKVKNSWPWFMKSLNEEATKYFKNEEIRRGQEGKKQGMAQNVKEFLAGLATPKAV